MKFMKGWLGCVVMFVAGVLLSDMVSPMMAKIPVIGQFFDDGESDLVATINEE